MPSPMPDPYLIYGATGYTGGLAARLAASRGQKPILAGRSQAPVRALAESLGLEHRTFGLEDPAALDRGLEGMEVVLHCAGPFSRTSRPMVEACLRTGTHYLDITGEALVFEALHARDAEARAAKVMLLPGAGFDVVPSDCLAAHLKRRLPARGGWPSPSSPGAGSRGAPPPPWSRTSVAAASSAGRACSPPFPRPGRRAASTSVAARGPP